MGDVSESEQLYKQFLAEGGSYEQSSNYQQAINCYDKAIDAISEGGQIQEEDLGIHCLCLRSRCHLRLGDHVAALADAEAALKPNKAYLKGLYAKAEALYYKGDFEFALVYFHRGLAGCEKAAGPSKNFDLGVQKSKEAIDNAIGNTDHCRLSAKGDLSGYYVAAASDEPTKRVASNQSSTSRRRQGTGRNRSAKAGGGKDRTVKQLLGDLYADKAYLEELCNDTTLNGALGQEVRGLASSGSSYLDKRTEFWRQQKPIYARVNEAKVNAQKQQMKGSAGRTQRLNAKPQKVVSLLESAEQALEKEDGALALKKSPRPEGGK